ncbi:Maf family protein [Qipengyuania sp. JC766]|uniref:Maf family protein n=1 Tax=Qipengyuania sp. JC766 TaxID=3232139 RepID=UPI00345761B3
MLVLASQSQSRSAMLQAAGIAFEAVPAEVDERALEREMEGADPTEIAQALAAAKAAAVSAMRPDDLVLGSDSLVTVEGERFDKPASREDAARHLRYFSGRTLRLHSAAALATGGRIDWIGSDMASLGVRELSDAFIEDYLAHEWPQVAGCVGVFRIEARGVLLFDRIVGDHFTILGMPLIQVLAALRERDVLE